MYRIGLDVGSTTLKCAVLDDSGALIYNSYERHFSKITEMTSKLLSELQARFGNDDISLTISGSAGMGLADACGIPFVQEVYATRTAVNTFMPGTEVVIELGGEDAKILFLGGELEVRMNGTCAGGTGAFIDQMATLLKVAPDEMNALAAEHEKIYTIASRCGVFAKSDIQPLLNQGAAKSDIAASIFYAVVNQTVAGLAQGRPIEGNILYLGGPLTFMSELRRSFDKTLNTEGKCPDNSLYFVAMGAALSGGEELCDLATAAIRVGSYTSAGGYRSQPPLFTDRADYEAFAHRHSLNRVEIDTGDIGDGEVFIGVDAGSTTVKSVVINKNGDIVMQRYAPGGGNPVAAVKNFLVDFYNKFPTAKVMGSAATGYGEDLIKNAFTFDFGLVETMAHFTAAKKFRPNVDFIIDIGGQDIKCFKIRGGAIDNIYLNEACSSGCGSFLQTFAEALGMDIATFAEKGLFADKPVDLGSRCTVFMNSSVKQAQKDGASIENISSGLSISVVKNALYKVIRARDGKSLGENIVVQGGTFLNDAVLRAFELETGREVIRPNISGLMGAYGAALYAMKKSLGASTTANAEKLASFTHNASPSVCKGCQNNCRLTINTFEDGRKYISGNRCERPVTGKSGGGASGYNMFERKREMLEEYKPKAGSRGRIGIPMGLGMYELYPFWYTFFTELGFEVFHSPFSTRKLYLAGQLTIPSDTVCFPAKLMHGHIEYLLKEEPDAIFSPCMSYNFDEGEGDNHFNCPVVAYYPEVLAANVRALKDTKFIYDYVGPHKKKNFPEKMTEILAKYFDGITRKEVQKAANSAYAEYDNYMSRIRRTGMEMLESARAEGYPIIVLAGRPYHIDPETHHGIDRLICSLGAAVLSEDSVSGIVGKVKTNVLNQWTYHARLYSAAKYVSQNKDMNLVQLVSFGCGVDAVTTDETREILEDGGKIYTQIKIDEITNLGAVKIRLRSLFVALEGEDA